MTVLGDLVSVETAAELLGGISPWTLHMWLSQGKLPRIKVGGRTMVRKSALEAFVAKGEGGKSRAPKKQRKAGKGV